MKQERWQEIERLCHTALAIEPGRRDAFLEKACAGDDSLRKEVGDLLAHKTEATEFMKAPAIHVAARVLAQDQENLPASDLIGRTIGRYRVLKKIGEGGMGEVFLAEESTLDRKVALKFLPPDMQQDVVARKRLLREARSAAALDHPFICHINEVGESEGKDFIAMEYVDGQRLSDRLQSGSLPVRETLQIASDIAEALEEAHDKGIIHRDLKPANIMLTRKGHAKVMDFGLAKQLPRADGQEESITRSGTVLGTVAYMSPEQLRGEPVDARSDIFSFGVVLYEMLAGVHPFKKQAGMDTAAAILGSAPRSIAESGRDVPTVLDRVVLKMLAKAPNDRYASVHDAQLALRQALADWERKSGRPRRMKTASLVAFVGLVVLGALIWAVQFFKGGDTQTSLIPVPFTTYRGSEWAPSFSPDGNQVVFWWDGEKQDNFDLYIKQIGSDSSRRLTFHEREPGAFRFGVPWGYGPAWSPDGQSIAYVRDLDRDRAALVMIPTNGGRERQVAEFRSVMGISWHPGGSWLAVGAAKDSRDASTAIYLISPETRERRRLTSTPKRIKGDPGTQDVDPAFSPDGQTLAFVRAGEIYLLRLSAALLPESEPKQLTFMHQFTGGLTWTPDGKEIIFASGSKVHDTILWRIAASGSGTPTPLPFSREVMVLSPKISLNHHRLVYTRNISDINIWRCPISGRDEKPVLPSRFMGSTRVQEGARYSPDGKAVAFLAFSSGRGQIWVSDSEGTNSQQLTFLNGHAPAPPSWSPDSKDLIFQRRGYEMSELCVISAQGGPIRQLSRTPAAPVLGEGPSYSRDGRWIYFGSDASGSAQVWKMPAAGGAAVPITRHGGTDPRESTDGKTLFYLKNDGDELWQVPVAGGEETRVLEGIFLGQFDLSRRGIYFVSKPDQAAAARPGQNESQFLFNFLFVPFAGGKTRRVAVIPELVQYGFSVSPDERWILYTQAAKKTTDLMLVENFR